MTRVLMGMTMVSMLATTSVFAYPKEPEVKIERDDERALVTLKAATFTLMETLTRSGVELRLEEGTDVVQFSADLEGQVVVTRGHRKRAFGLRSATFEDRAALVAMLAESPALAAFDRLLQSTWARSPRASLFTSTREILRVLEGDYTSVAQMMPVRRFETSASLRRVAQRSPSECWDTYARDVIHFTYELQSCLNSASYQWWNPFATAWCAYEYNLKSSLASVWLLDCYGVPV
jgi:hypothetical protein